MSELSHGGAWFLGAAFTGAPDSLWFTLTFACYLLSFLGFVLYGANKQRKVARVATWLIAAGGLLHTVAIAVRWSASGHVPFSNMYEYANIMAWMAVVSFLVILWRYDRPILGLYVSPLVVALIVSASLLPNDVTKQLVPALQSYWLPIHVVLAALGEGAFLVASAVSIMYLILARRREGRATAGSRASAGGRATVAPAAGPGAALAAESGISLETLDEINYKALSIGYPLFTVGALFAGAIWAYTAWGSFWSWDPKEVGALVIWLFYTLFLHARFNRGWRGNKAAWMSVVGFVMILLSFFGNIFLGGQHAYG
jgi:cytochrome c-type biogenesis protein CcsB